MALAKVIKINIIGHQKDKNNFLDILQSTSLTQIEDQQGELEKSDSNEQIAEVDYQLAGVKFSLDFLTPYDDAKKSLIERMNSKIDLTLAEVENIFNNFDFETKTEVAQEIESKINKAQNLKDKLNADLKLLAPWSNIGFSPNKKNASNFGFAFLSAKEDVKEKFSKKLQADFPISELQSVGTNGDKKDQEELLLLIYKKSDEVAVNEFLASSNIKIIELPSLTNTIPERLKEINVEITKAENEIKDQQNAARKLINDLKNFKIIFDYLTWKKDKLSNQTKAGNTWQTFTLTGWMDQKQINPLEKALSKVSNDFSIEEIEATQDEVPPVIMKNTWATDFESITDLYGSPNTNDPDPSPWLAPFFILFFGMAMADAGYGIIMTLGIIAAIKILKIPRNKQKLLRVLMWGGVATFILGALTGGWFSIDLTILPAIISGPLLAIKVIDPINDPLLIFYISLGLGVLQVLTGLAIGTIWKIKSGQALDGILGNGAWFMLIVSAMLQIGGSMGMLPVIVGTIGQWLIFASVIAIMYNGTRGTKNIYLKPGLGILSLYNVVGYFSDILSYSRLLALGLTTTIIGTVVNIIAGLVFSLPYVGWLAALVILIGGHIFNIAINALGAFIHSARLQFIEFFPKFLEAGGETFEPFSKESKYINLINN